MRAKIAIALGIVYVVWGSTYLAIAVADRTLPPLLMLAVRFALAGGLLYAWSAWRGAISPGARLRFRDHSDPRKPAHGVNRIARRRD